jgi:TatD DNase family protein
MRLFDSHAHLDMKVTQKEVQAMLNRAWDTGVIGIMAIAGANKALDFGNTLALASKERRVWAAAGIHPHAGFSATPDALDKLRFALDHQRVMALGEIGLDYHYNHSEPADQRRAFVSQMRLAHHAALPVVIHTREADYDTLSILRDEGAGVLGGVIHCFSSNMDFARKVLDMGLFISFSGIITFPKADPLTEVAEEMPIDKILAETDTPFLSPIPFRGRPNEPARVRHTVEKLAEIKGIDTEEMAEITTENTMRCFRISQ